MLDVRFWVGLILLVVSSSATFAENTETLDCEISPTVNGTETFDQRECLKNEILQALERIRLTEVEIGRLSDELERIGALEEENERIDARLAEVEVSLERARADLFAVQQQLRDRNRQLNDIENRLLVLESDTFTREQSTLTAIHAAVGGACLALGAPVSGVAHISIPRRARETCTNACRTHPGNYPNCRGMVAIGRILTERASNHTDMVNINYRYECGDTQDRYDEIRGDDKEGAYLAYCCCYR